METHGQPAESPDKGSREALEVEMETGVEAAG